MDDDGEVAAPGGRPDVATLYRLGSNQSNASVFEDVEMAHDEASNPAAIHMNVGSSDRILVVVLRSCRRELADKRFCLFPPSPTRRLNREFYVLQ